MLPPPLRGGRTLNVVAMMNVDPAGVASLLLSSPRGGAVVVVTVVVMQWGGGC